MSRFRRTYGQGTQLITDTIGPTPLVLIVPTFADLPASPENYQQVVVLDNGIGSLIAIGVVWISAASKWYATYSGGDFVNLPVGGIWSVAPPVESAPTATFVFQSPTLAAVWDGAAWIQLVDVTPVATFADLPASPILYQTVLVLDNGYTSPAWAAFDGTDWIVISTRVSAFGDLPADGVWNLSPSVISDTDTVVNNSGMPNTYWNWDGAAWDEYTLSLPETVAEYTDLPVDPPVDYKILCSNTSLLGLGPLQSVILQHTAGNSWSVVKAAINDVTELPGSATIFSDVTYTVTAVIGTILYSADRAWVYTGAAWQEYTPGSTFTSFASLPALPPDNFSAYIYQDEGSMFHPILLQYNAISDEWEIISALWEEPSTLPDLSTPFYDIGGITVVGKVGTILDSLGRKFVWGGASWTETVQYNSRNWGGTNEATVNYSIGASFHLDGDTFVDQSLAGTVTKIWNTAQWYYYRIEWDGVSIGQTYADLPVVDVYTEAVALVGTDVYYWDGAAWTGNASAPTVTVGAFSLLPSDAIVGQRCGVTGEIGLTDVICVNTGLNTWELETATCAYSVYSAIEWGSIPGVWDDSGTPVVTTASGATITDTTNNDVVLWDATNTQFVPRVVYAGTIAGVQKIKGDSAAPSGWTVTDTDGGGTASITTAGGKVTLSVTTAAIASTLASVAYTDASLSSAGNWYLRGMVQITTLSGRQASARVAVFDGTDAYDFGSARNVGAATATGQWYNPASLNAAYTAQSGAQLDLASAEVLLEMVKVGTRCAARVAGGVWIDLTGASARNSASTQVVITAVVSPDTATQSDAVMTLRHVCAMRF